MNRRGTVLAVDDEPDLVELYALWLADEYAVRTATSGREALDALDETIDVVLLDRQMPDISGDDVLERIDTEGLDCRVAMVTAVTPDFDILELPFDDYLVKPVSAADLCRVVDALLLRSTYDAAIQDYFALVSKWAALKTGTNEADRTADPRFADLETRLATHRETVDDLLTNLDGDDLDGVFRDLARSHPNPNTENGSSP